MYFTVETMRLGGDWPRVTNFVLKDDLIILFCTHPGYWWLLVENRKTGSLAIITALLPRNLFRFLSYSLCTLFR